MDEPGNQASGQGRLLACPSTPRVYSQMTGESFKLSSNIAAVTVGGLPRKSTAHCHPPCPQLCIK